MATKTFEELKQLAIQIRDEKTNKANTATRIGTQMIEHLNKLEQEYYTIQTVDGLVSEYNVSVNHPTSGIDGSNKYTLSSAIALVPEKYRSIGIKCSFLNESGQGECWEWMGGEWATIRFMKTGAAKLNIITLSSSNYSKELSAIKTIKGKSIGVDGNLMSEGSDTHYVTMIYEIDNKNIAVSGYSIGWNRANYALYSSQDISSSTLLKLGSIIKVTAETQIGEIIPAQQGKVYLVISRYIRIDENKQLRAYLICDRESSLQEETAKINSSLNGELLPCSTPLPYINEYIGKAIDLEGNISSLASDKYVDIKIYKVTEGDNLIIFGNVTGYDRLLYAFYMEDDITEEMCVQKGPNIRNASTVTPDYVNSVVTVPRNAKYLAISAYRYSDLNLNFNILQLYTAKLYANYDKYAFMVDKNKTSGAITVTRSYYPYGKMSVILKPCGANNLTQINAVVYTGNNGYTQQSNSDWVGPYIITADVEGDETNGFTGGWHGYNGDQTGASTARTNNVKLLCDNKEVDSGLFFCNSVKIIVENFIQAGNTKNAEGTGREVLKEIVVYHFIGDSVKVSVFSTALENLKIHTYYGMQIEGYFNTYDFVAEDKIHKSENKEVLSVASPTRLIIGTNANGDKVEARLLNIGLGTLKYSKKTSYSFCQSYGKAYYSLIGEIYPLANGESIYWEGEYIFKK